MSRLKNKKGFTLIEILIIIAIIAILVTVVLISLISARQKSQDASAFTSIKSAAAPAFICMSSGSGLNLNPYIPNVNICNDANVTPGSVWPDLSRTGWTSFSWCPPNYVGSNHPAPCMTYDNTHCGGDNAAGNFCFMMNNDNKYIWCTLKGCRKEGF